MFRHHHNGYPPAVIVVMAMIAAEWIMPAGHNLDLALRASLSGITPLLGIVSGGTGGIGSYRDFY